MMPALVVPSRVLCGLVLGLAFCASVWLARSALARGPASPPELPGTRLSSNSENVLAGGNRPRGRGLVLPSIRPGSL